MVLKDHNVEVRIFFILLLQSQFFSVVHISPSLASNDELIPHKNVSWQVLSELLADLDACDSQKGDTKVLANGEVAPG